MIKTRREFIKTSALAATGLGIASCSRDAVDKQTNQNYSELDKIIDKPILKKELFPNPIIIDSMELLQYKENFICRVISKDGAEGISVSNNMQMQYLYPIMINRVIPFFRNKDARNLDTLLQQLYVFRSNYKLQSLALWVPIATAEFAILDMLGRIAQMPIGELISKTLNRKISVYQANNFRGKTVEDTLSGIRKILEQSGAKAIKFKIGGRMSNPEYPPYRSEKLIPEIHKTFGNKIQIFADANGSYDVMEAIRIGKILEENRIVFFEEPVPFDRYEDTLEVKRNLNIKIAGGEQEPSLNNFRWLIGNRALDIVQPDIFYFGGMIRSFKVALMANKMGMECIPHISGSGLGYLYMMHFVSVIPNAGKYHEFKGLSKEIPFECETSDLEIENGEIIVPSGPGLGVEIDPKFLEKHKKVVG